jgi:hypothetical protein
VDANITAAFEGPLCAAPRHKNVRRSKKQIPPIFAA